MKIELGFHETKKTFEFIFEKWKNFIKYLIFYNLIVGGYEYVKSKDVELL